MTKRGHDGGEKGSVEVEEDGLTFCFRAPAVRNDNDDANALEGDSDRVGRKIWAKGCGEDVDRRLRLKESVTGMGEEVGRPLWIRRNRRLRGA